jgi:hypothetical protein
MHPLGGVALALLAAAVFFHIVGTKYLIGNFSWWHWVGLVVVAAASVRPAILHRTRLALEILPAFHRDAGMDPGLVRLLDPAMVSSSPLARARSPYQGLRSRVADRRARL